MEVFSLGAWRASGSRGPQGLRAYCREAQWAPRLTKRRSFMVDAFTDYTVTTSVSPRGRCRKAP